MVDTAQGLTLVGSSGIRVTIRRGEVYRLTVSASVSKRLNENLTVWRFAAGLLGTRTETRGGEVFHLVSPTHLVLEAATDRLPSERMAWDALTSTFRMDKELHQVVVRIAATANADSREAFRHVHRAEIDRQAWRWQGRPPAPHPDLAADDRNCDDEAMRRWIASEFGDRRDGESLTQEMGTLSGGTSPDASGRRTFEFREVLSDGQKMHDLRGHHLRHAVRVYSRYEGLMPEPVSVTATEFIDDSAPGMTRTVESPWRSVFVPSRAKSPLPVPRVKLVLPLTDAYGDSDRNPGLLVVFNEAWHEIGGLGEGLSVDVGLARNPWENPLTTTNATYYVEFGPDPIVRRYDAGTVFAQPIAADQRVPVEIPVAAPACRGDARVREMIAGPVGHYFDPDNRSALFVGTSFILPAPRMIDASDSRFKDVGWHFAHLRFRRVVRRRLPRTETAAAAYVRGPDWPLSSIQSDPTDPMWVQYVPDFSLFASEASSPLKVDDLRPVVNPAARALQLVSRMNEQAQRLDPTASDPASFELFAVLTRRVLDLTGRADQEAYLAVFERGTDGRTWTTDAPLDTMNLTPDVPYRVRVIEIQRSNLTRPAGDACQAPPVRGTPSRLWELLFPQGAVSQSGRDVPCDTHARIVRMSAPMDSMVNASDGCPTLQEV